MRTEFPQGLKPIDSLGLMSELKLRPPSNLVSEPFAAQGRLKLRPPKDVRG
jgi:hypothetical protein